MVSKPFDVHELRATVTRLALGIKPGAGNSLQLSPESLHNLLKTALLEEDATDDAMEGGS